MRYHALTRTVMVGVLLSACQGDSQANQAEQQAVPARPMILGAASNFSQGWNEATLQAALALPVRRYRDSIRWTDVERTIGTYAFDKPSARYPALLEASGSRLTLTLNWGNPNYDGGKTPHSAEALAAFGRFAAEAVRRYPAIDAVEIGNEINGGNFVSGPVKEGGLAQRHRYHLAMVRAARTAIKAERPEVRVLGGAVHSLPAGFLWKLLAAPGADVIDGLAVHPYTTPVDQLPAQFAMLRKDQRAARLPIYVTEFGSQNPQTAADDLVRGYAVLAALGVKEMDWYPLNERGDGMVPLLRRDQSLTTAGQAFRFVQEQLASRPAAPRDIDDFTLVRSFGANVWVVWGAPRALKIGAEVTAYDATGSRLDPAGLKILPDKVVILIARAPLIGGRNVHFGCQNIIADSFYQFDYTARGGGVPDGSGLERFAEVAGRELLFEVMPGQQRGGVPWTPYLGHVRFPQLRLQAETMLPAFANAKGAIVHRYIAPEPQRIRLEAEFTVAQRNGGNIRVTVSQSGRVLRDFASSAEVRLDDTVTVAGGEALTIAVSSDTSSKNATKYRIRLSEPDKCSH